MFLEVELSSFLSFEACVCVFAFVITFIQNETIVGDSNSKLIRKCYLKLFIENGQSVYLEEQTNEFEYNRIQRWNLLLVHFKMFGLNELNEMNIHFLDA